MELCLRRVDSKPFIHSPERTVETVPKTGYRPLASESKRAVSSSSAGEGLGKGVSTLASKRVRWVVASQNLRGFPVSTSRVNGLLTPRFREVKFARPDMPPSDTTEISEADFLRHDGAPDPVGGWVREMEDPSSQRLLLYGILCSAHERFRTARDDKHACEIAARARDALFAAFAPLLRDAEHRWFDEWTYHDADLLTNAFQAVSGYCKTVSIEPSPFRERLLLGISSSTFREYAQGLTNEENVRAWAKLLHNLRRFVPVGVAGEMVNFVQDILTRVAQGDAPPHWGLDAASDSSVAQRVKRQRHAVVKARLTAHLPDVLAELVCTYSDAPPVGGDRSYWLDDLDLRNAVVVAPARVPTPMEDVQASAELTVDGRVSPVFVMDRKSDAQGRYRVCLASDSDAEHLHELRRFEAIWDDALSFPPKRFWVPKEFLDPHSVG